MQFNQFIWSLYANSEEGRRAIERELADHVATIPATRESAVFKHQMFYCETANDEIVDGGINGFEEVDLRERIREFAEEEEVESLDAAETLFIRMADESVVWTHENNGTTFDRVFGGGNDAPACQPCPTIRHTPEAMLKLAQAEEAQSGQGRLKIFLGYAARNLNFQDRLDALAVFPQHQPDRRTVRFCYISIPTRA